MFARMTQTIYVLDATAALKRSGSGIIVRITGSGK